MSNAVESVASAKEVVTKSDIVRIEEAIKQMATKVDLAKLDSKIERSLRYQIMWMVGIGTAAIGVLKFL